MQLVKKTMMMAGALLLALNVCGQENVPAEKKVEKKVTSENHDADKVNFKVSADVVSSYIWRGAYNAGASIQPTLGMSAVTSRLRFGDRKRSAIYTRKLILRLPTVSDVYPCLLPTTGGKVTSSGKKRIILLPNILIWTIMTRNIVWRLGFRGQFPRGFPCLWLGTQECFGELIRMPGTGNRIILLTWN